MYESELCIVKAALDAAVAAATPPRPVETRLQQAASKAARAERLAAKAASKLSDLESASQLTDPDALARKRVVVEAALERARARRRNTAGG